MKKSTILLLSILSLSTISAQTITYDFSQDPFANGWTSVTEPGSGNGVYYESVNQRLRYDVTTGVENNFIHRTVPYALNDQFCVSFKVHPDTTNYNAFFPLLLAPNNLTGSDIHPWRMNANQDGSAGNPQNLDIIGVMFSSMEIKFVNRNGNTYNASSLVSFTQPFSMTSNTDYWIKLEGVSATEARLSVYLDAAMTIDVRDQLFTIPDLASFNELYIANCNGNTATNQWGTLDDYVINRCSVAAIAEIAVSLEEWELFPNPSTDLVTIRLDENAKQLSSILLIDGNGKTVVNQLVDQSNTEYSIDISTLSTGVYTVVLNGNKAFVPRRFVKL